MHKNFVIMQKIKTTIIPKILIFWRCLYLTQGNVSVHTVKTAGYGYPYTWEGECRFSVPDGYTSWTVNITFNQAVSAFGAYEGITVQSGDLWKCVKNQYGIYPPYEQALNFQGSYFDDPEPVGLCIVLFGGTDTCLSSGTIDNATSTSTTPSTTTTTAPATTTSTTTTTTTTTAPSTTTTATTQSTATTATTPSTATTATTTTPSTTTITPPTSLTTTTPSISTNTALLLSTSTYTTTMSSTLTSTSSTTATTVTTPSTSASTPRSLQTSASTNRTLSMSTASTTTPAPSTITTSSTPMCFSTTPTSASNTSCWCVCNLLGNETLSESEFNLIIANLTIDKDTVSATIRKKTSAMDNRPSSQSIGALGAVLICTVVGLMFASDLANVYHGKSLVKRGQKLPNSH